MNKLNDLIKSINVHEVKTGRRITKVLITSSVYDELNVLANNEMELIKNNFNETGYYGRVNGIPIEIDDDQKEDFTIVD